MSETINYFDLQINGYGGVDFNQDDLPGEELRRACDALAADGVTGICATIITEQLDVMCRRIARLVELAGQDEVVGRMVAGIHVEGPFINAEDGPRGAHPADSVVPATPEAAGKLLDAGGGLVKILTLAPEFDAGCATTRWLAGRGVIVAAGHCDPSRDQLAEACDAGLSYFTHLGNGCHNMVPRHDNIVQRVLSLADRLWVSFIADGVHVPLFALGNYLQVAGPERCVVVSDAIASAGLGPGTYTISRWTLQIGEDLVARSHDGSHLVGSAITMKRSAENLRSMGLDEDTLRLMMAENPRKVLDQAGG